jgi:hypothetical protein
VSTTVTQNKRNTTDLFIIEDTCPEQALCLKFLSMTRILKRERRGDRPPLNGISLVMTRFYIDKLYRSVYHLSTLSLPFYHSCCPRK